MMKTKCYKFLAAGFISLSFLACSDMAVDSADAVGLPSDFTIASYQELNPDVLYAQIRRDLSKRNQVRLDSTNKLYHNAETGELVITSDSPPTGFSNDSTAKAIRAKAKANYDADNAAFLADEKFVKEIFIRYLGIDSSLWLGLDSLNSEQKSLLYTFNLQQQGKPNLEADKQYLENFQFDEDLIKKHYLLLGLLEGRPYRYCDGLSTGNPISKVVPDTIKNQLPYMPDYSAHRFCLNENEGLVYVIK